MNLKTGPLGAVHGRLPDGWRIAAQFDMEAGIVRVNSPDTNEFLVNIEIGMLHEYGPTHKPIAGVLKDASIQAKYDAAQGEFRCDAMAIPEFWLEVRMHDIVPHTMNNDDENDTPSDML